MILNAFEEMFARIVQWVEGTAGVSAELQTLIVSLLLIILIPYIVRRIALYVITRQFEDAQTIYNWRKGCDYIAIGLGILLAWRLLFANTESDGSWTTYLGLVTAGLAIALQDLIVNFIGWVFLLVRRPFEVGDRIEIGSYAGDVVDLRFFQFSLLEIGGWVDAEQSTGRVLHIPNKYVFTHGVASYTKGFAYIWSELAVEVTFESDWKKAKVLLQEIADRRAIEPDRKRVRETGNRYGITYHNLSPTVYTSVEPSGVELTIRFLCEPRKRRNAMEALWEDILDAFSAESDIDLAYPTQRHIVDRPGLNTPAS